MSTLPNVEDEMRRIVRESEDDGIHLRLIGGLAIKVHCPSASHRSLQRKYPDIDFVTDKKGARRLANLLPALGYTPNKTFNTLNGSVRQLYYDEAQGRQVDVFIGEFDMAHKIPLSGRLDVEPLTLPLAELFLSKAQIVHLNHKDVLDILALLVDHRVGVGDQETINTEIVADLCSRDWGLFTTVSMAMQKVNDILAQGNIELGAHQAELVKRRMGMIQEVMDAAPKTVAWKMRSKVGTRARWYQEVEEVQR